MFVVMPVPSVSCPDTDNLSGNHRQILEVPSRVASFERTAVGVRGKSETQYWILGSADPLRIESVGSSCFRIAKLHTGFSGSPSATSTTTNNSYQTLPRIPGRCRGPFWNYFAAPEFPPGYRNLSQHHQP